MRQDFQVLRLNAHLWMTEAFIELRPVLDRSLFGIDLYKMLEEQIKIV